MQMYKAKIKGTGMYVPKKVLTNYDLEKMVDTSHKWIVERSGIIERRICSTEGGEWPSDMALYATKIALERAQMVPNDIDMILFGTLTNDVQLPSTATILQTKLGITNHCACLDISAACSGFVYGFNIANAMIQTGMMKNILVVGAEMLSRQVDWSDRNECILFGDGAGVAIVGRSEEGDTSEIIKTSLTADGTGRKFFVSDHGGSISPITEDILKNRLQFMKMKGREIFKVAVRTLTDNVSLVLEDSGITADQVDWMVPHQANIRIIEAVAKRIGISMEKVIVNIHKYGNTSAATVPIAFHEACAEGKIKRGDIVLFDVFGAGLTSGATVFRY
ncbi:MAG: ketoacyl-ACP synthase III [Bacteriovoracaceae bacterium]|nr:ketoacyl-ACP synthase III [Bacteriovoracaceae bacterium]